MSLPMATRTGEAAVAWGHTQITHPNEDWSRQCLKFVRSCFGVPMQYPNAGSAWDHAVNKHRDPNPMHAPRAAAGFFETPGIADHVVLTLGNGLCLTNDFGAGNLGKITVARIADIESHWNAPFLGWTTDLNSHRIYVPPPPAAIAKPKVDDPRATRFRNQWREDGLVDVDLASELRKAGHPAADVIAVQLPKIRAAAAEIYNALD